MLRSVAAASTTELQCLYAHSMEGGEERENEILETLAGMQEQFEELQEQHQKEIGILEGRIALFIKEQMMNQETLQEQRSTIEKLKEELSEANKRQLSQAKEVAERRGEIEICTHELVETRNRIRALETALEASERASQRTGAALEALERKKIDLQKEINLLKVKGGAAQQEVLIAATRAGVPKISSPNAMTIGMVEETHRMALENQALKKENRGLRSLITVEMTEEMYRGWNRDLENKAHRLAVQIKSLFNGPKLFIFAFLGIKAYAKPPDGSYSKLYSGHLRTIASPTQEEAEKLKMGKNEVLISFKTIEEAAEGHPFSEVRVNCTEEPWIETYDAEEPGCTGIPSDELLNLLPSGGEVDRLKEKKKELEKRMTRLISQKRALFNDPKMIFFECGEYFKYSAIISDTERRRIFSGNMSCITSLTRDQQSYLKATKHEVLLCFRPSAQCISPDRIFVNCTETPWIEELEQKD